MAQARYSRRIPDKTDWSASHKGVPALKMLYAFVRYRFLPFARHDPIVATRRQLTEEGAEHKRLALANIRSAAETQFSYLLNE